MKQSYISYYEGYDKDGLCIFNGNHAVKAETEDGQEPVNGDELLTGCLDYILQYAQDKNPKVTRVVIKGLFRL